MGAPSPAIFTTGAMTPRTSTVMMMVMMVMVMMVVRLRWGGHCQNGKGCASEDHFL